MLWYTCYRISKSMNELKVVHAQTRVVFTYDSYAATSCWFVYLAALSAAETKFCKCKLVDRNYCQLSGAIIIT